jgi:hypothetical protein
MKRIVFLLLSFIGLTATVHAQTFMQHLLQQKPGNGKITVSQSHDIDVLVNGKDAQEAVVDLRRTALTNTTQKKTTNGQTQKTAQTVPTKKTVQTQKPEQTKKSEPVRNNELANKAERAARIAQEAKADSIEKARERWRREQEAKAQAQKAANEKNAVEEALALEKRIAEKNAQEKAAEAKRNAEKAEAEHRAEVEEEFNIPTVDMRKKVMRGARNVIGYRVQAFAGGNTRADKQKAQQAGNAIKMRFPDQPIYVHFYSPRWICRVGNYKSIGEARRMLSAVKAMGYKSAIIVKGKITVFE